MTDFFFKKKSSIIKLTTLNTNKQETIRGIVADPTAYVVSVELQSQGYKWIVSTK